MKGIGVTFVDPADTILRSRMDSSGPLDGIRTQARTSGFDVFRISAIRTFAVMPICPRTSGEAIDGPVFGVVA